MELQFIAQAVITCTENHFNKERFERIGELFAEIISMNGKLEPNLETTESAFWDINNLPNLATEKNNEEQIKMCFDAYKSENRIVILE